MVRRPQQASMIAAIRKTADIVHVNHRAGLMNLSVHYGVDSTLELEIDSSALVADYDLPRGSPLADPGAATLAALAAPLEFPPLRKAVIPGDRVVLAVAEGVPQAPAIVRAVAKALIDAGITAGDICIVHSAREPAA